MVTLVRNQSAKAQAYAKNRSGGKADFVDTKAITQIFTPQWVAQYLVENSIGRLWMLNNPQSSLVEHMDFYIPPDDGDYDYLQINDPKEITCLDPACGDGNLLVAAYYILELIYEEAGFSSAEIPGLILENNLFGWDIDPDVVARCQDRLKELSGGCAAINVKVLDNKLAGGLACNLQ